MASIVKRVMKIQAKLSKAIAAWGTTITRSRDVIDGISVPPVQYNCIVDPMRIAYLHPNDIDYGNYSSDNSDPQQFLFDWTADIKEEDLILYGGIYYVATRIVLQAPANIIVSKLAIGIRRI
jgi:hypothetical protein